MRTLAWAACLAAVVACAGSDTRTSDVAKLQADLDSTRASLDSTKNADDRRIADSVRREESMPRRLALLTGTVSVAAPGGQDVGYAVVSFSLPSAGRCKVSARIEVLPGGHKDLAVVLFRNDDFINWKNSKYPFAPANALFASEPHTISTLDVAIPDLGTYDLVLSNRFSTFTAKTALSNAEVICIGSPIPLAAKAT